MRRSLLPAAVLALAIATPAATAPADPLATEALLADIQTYVDLGPKGHMTATASDRATQSWIAGQLRSAGLAPRTDAFTFQGFTVRKVELTVAGQRVEARPMFYSGRTGPGGVEAPTAYAGNGSGGEISRAGVRGKIAVVELNYVKNAVERTFDATFDALSDAGAVGLIAVTNGPEDFPINRNVDVRAGLRVLPVVFVGRRSGAAVRTAAQAGETAHLALDAEVGPACATNTYAVLPGASDRVVIAGTPVSAWDVSASERGPGVAILLALARRYAALPRSERPVTLVFVLTSGHELGFLGLPSFIRAHPDWFTTADAYVHLGASLAARDYLVDGDGDTQPLESGEPTRALYTSENPQLQAIAGRAFEQAQPLGNTPPRALNPGEQSYAYAVGVPIVSSSGAGTYFHTDGDLLPAVQPELLRQMALSYRDAIDGIAGAAPGAIRAANGAAAAGTSPPSGEPNNGSNLLEPAPAAACTATPSRSCPATRSVRVRLPRGYRYGGRATAAGRRINRVRARGRSVSFTIDIRHVATESFVVRIRARTPKGRRVMITRRVRTCPNSLGGGPA